MYSHSHRLLAVVLTFVFFNLPNPASAQLSSTADPMRSEVVLGFRTITVVSTPSLRADSPVYRALLSTANVSPDVSVRVGSFETDASVHVDAVEIQVDEPETSGGEVNVARYDLWLSSTDRAWILRVAESQENGATEPSEVLGAVRLSHVTAVNSPSAIASVVPTGSDEGLFILRWGQHKWTTNLRFSTPRPRVRRRRENGVGDDRTFDFDPSELQRATRLNTRNVATVTLPGGQTLSVVYPKDLKVEDADFGHLVSVSTGAVVRVTAGAVIRLDTDVPLKFGDVTLETGNVGLRDSPGAYGIWLKRAADGWSLLFNDEPDAWGTQHNPAFDAAEINLNYSQSADSSRAMSASVVMTTVDQGRFILVWGPHEWTATFTVGS